VILNNTNQVKRSLSPVEAASITRAKNPQRFILLMLLAINLLFFLLASLLIMALLPLSIGHRNYWECMYFAITMVLDAGCISNVIEDVGVAGVSLIIACVIIVIIGMILFTGGAIGYVSNVIGNIIDNTNAGKWKLRVSGHTVILNWNNRASEIINDMLYSEQKETVVVLTSSNPAQIKAEIEERLYDTIESENRAMEAAIRKTKGFFSTLLYMHHHKLRRSHVTVIVREGDTYSTKMLSDVSVKNAKAVVVLGSDIQNNVCQYNQREILERNEKGNSNLVKTAIQVADMTAAVDSADNQQLIVEVDDAWTGMLIDRVMEHKKNTGKNNIVPVSADKILGQILSQFSLMPELSSIYSELFSNKGSAFYSRVDQEEVSNAQFVEDYLARHFRSVPLMHLRHEGSGGEVDTCEYYFMAGSDEDVDSEENVSLQPYSVKLNYDFWLTRRNVIILGHNTKCSAIMEGFDSFRNEWNFKRQDLIDKYGPEILNITVIDDPDSLAKRNYYRDYPYVKNVVEADIFDRGKIMDMINQIVDENIGDTSILILSDDSVVNEDIDSAALTYLIYVQDIISEHQMRDPDFDESSIDVIVEILNPKNHDVVQNYSRTNIVISNRFISKMVTQISAKREIFDLYSDILIYDDADANSFDSMELYVKPVDEFFEELPEPCSAAQLIRAVYEAGPEDNKSIVLGYVEHSGNMVIFSGDHSSIHVALKPDDKIILFSNH